ncbi:hypothetical protein LINPERPRIM_LOCUS18746, partial [Linum perenne]
MVGPPRVIVRSLVGTLSLGEARNKLLSQEAVPR